MTPGDRLLSVDEVAELLGVPRRWIYEQTRFNKIPHYRVGRYCRFSLPEIKDWLTKFHRAGEGAQSG